MAYKEKIARLRELEQIESKTVWEQAEIVADLVEEGYSQAQIAQDSGYSRSKITQLKKAWQAYGSLGPKDRPSVYEAYRADLEDRKTAQDQPLTEEDEEELLDEAEEAEETHYAIVMADEINKAVDRVKNAIKAGRQVGPTESKNIARKSRRFLADALEELDELLQ